SPLPPTPARGLGRLDGRGGRGRRHVAADRRRALAVGSGGGPARGAGGARGPDQLAGVVGSGAAAVNVDDAGINCSPRRHRLINSPRPAAKLGGDSSGNLTPCAFKKKARSRRLSGASTTTSGSGPFRLR